MEISIRKCRNTDLGSLQDLAIQTYDETFRAYNSSENMRTYLDEAFNKNQLKKELNNPSSEFYLLFADQAPAAYLKTNEPEAQTDIFDPQSLEIERIYVKQEFQRHGLGKKLIELGIDIARKQNRKFVWLGVWEHNTRALQFYKNMGFEKFGSHRFIMGDDHQTDWLLQKIIR